MKIIHISKSDTGGAGIAALRLHKAMLSEGIDSTFLCLNRKNNSNEPKVVKFFDSIVRKLYRASRLPFNKYVKHKKILKKLKGNYEAFSFTESDYFLHDHELIKEADIINLHFIHGFVDFRSFFLKVKKPIFWTMHDMNPWQGGFHYEDDVKNNSLLFGNLEKQLIFSKKEIYSSCPNLNVIALNNSFLNISSNSYLLSDKRHFYIPNTLDFSIFDIQNKTESRDFYQLPQDKIIVLFASYNITNPRKGGDLALEILEKNQNAKIIFCQVGEGERINNPEEMINIGSISEEKNMAKLYSAVDVVILPSREDNLPNVMVEALSCGTPVIATPVGGCVDIIKPYSNGFLAADVTAEALLHCIDLFFENRNNFDKVKIRNMAKEKFGQEKVVSKYLQAYSNAKN